MEFSEEGLHELKWQAERAIGNFQRAVETSVAGDLLAAEPL
jgi:hypothetical protein